MDPARRSSAKKLLLHPWIVDNEAERQQQFEELGEVRKNFADMVYKNFNELESMTDFEIDLVHELNSVQLYDEMADMINLLFDACDINGGPDGRISFEEFKRACANMNVFASSSKTALQG